MARDKHKLGDLLDEAFENAPVPTLLVSAEGIWLRANRSMCALVGYGEDELVDRRAPGGRRSTAPSARTTAQALKVTPVGSMPPSSSGFSAITHPDDLYLDAEYVERMLTGVIDTYRIEKRYVHRDGREVWVDLHASVVRDEAGEPRFFIYQSEDISSRKEMEHALRRSEGDFRLLAENATDVISRHARDGTILYVTPSCEALYGYRPDELVGLPLASICDARDLDRVSAELARLDEATAPVRVDLRARRKDGSTVWVEATAKLLFGDLGTEIHLAARDVQAQKAAEAQVKSSEERFRTLIEGAPDAVLVTTSGRVAYANPALVRFLGYESAKEIVGRPASSLFSGAPVRPSREWSALTTGLEEERGPEVRVSGLPYQRHMLRKDGARVPTEIAELSVDFDGRPSTLLYARDLTERERLIRKLVQADRRSAIGTLAAGIAHEINNPLAYVLANLELAIEALEDQDADRKDEVRELLREAEKGTSHVRAVVRDMKQLSSGADSDKGLIDLRSVVEATLRVSMSQIRPKAHLRTEIADVPAVLARASQLEQVMLNLLVNAVQSLPDDGRTDHEIFVRLGPRGNKVVLEIKDTGPGIPKATQARIFDPFFTTRSGSAVGLGLSLAQSTIQELGGELAVESDPERGSTFRVILPVADLRAPPPGADAALAPAAQGGPRRARVLVIDDEKPVALALARALRSEHDVDVAVSAQEGLQQLVVAPYDVIFCDLMMSDMSGPLIFERAVARDAKLRERFVFLTGGSFTPRARAFIEDTTNVVIQKPYDVTRIRKLIVERMVRPRL